MSVAPLKVLNGGAVTHPPYLCFRSREDHVFRSEEQACALRRELQEAVEDDRLIDEEEENLLNHRCFGLAACLLHRPPVTDSLWVPPTTA